MFDKLIESDTEGAEFKNRSRYFTVSTLVVGALFLSAVMYSLYAAEIGIGAGNFELAELVAPLETTDPEPVHEPDRAQVQASRDNSAQTSRQHLIAPTDVSMLEPKGVSVVKSPFRTLDPTKFGTVKQGPDSDAGTPSGLGREKTTGTSADIGPRDAADDEEIARSNPPPPAREKVAKAMVSEGVINGKATFLPIPGYPQPARLVGAAGEVRVQVTIDESGRVVSAKAVSGHPLLRNSAETSARSAKFSITYLSRVPVKVTGIITYNFKKP